MKKPLSLLAAAALIATSLIGCSSGTSSSSSVSSAAGTSSAASNASSTVSSGISAPSADGVNLRVTWWGNQVRADRTTKVMNMFAEKNGVKVEAEFTDWTGYWDKLATQTAAKTAPTVFQQDYGYIMQYADRGAMEGLNKWVDQGVLSLDGISDSVLDGGRVKGELYGVNLGSNSTAFLYRKALADKAGVTIKDSMTWDEYFEACKTIYEKTGVKTNVYIGSGPGVGELVGKSARNAGFAMYSEDGKALGFDDDALITRAYNIIETYKNSEWALKPDIYVGRTGTEQDVISDGTAWNTFTNSNQMVSYQAAAGEGPENELGIVQYPEFADAKRPAPFIKPSQFFSIASSSSDAEKYWGVKFIDYVTNDIDCNNVLLGERGVPINPKVADAIAPLLTEVDKKVIDYVAYATEHCSPIDPPNPATASELGKNTDMLADEMLYGQRDVASAVQEFKANASSILPK